MAGEYPKLLQENDFLKLRVQQLLEINAALADQLHTLTNGEYSQELPHTKYYDGEIED